MTLIPVIVDANIGKRNREVALADNQSIVLDVMRPIDYDQVS